MTRPPSRTRRALLALTALLTTALAVLAPTASAAAPGTASAAQQQTFGIQPASASGPDQRAALTYAATPGAQLKDHVAVYNYGDDPLTLSLYAADAFNTSTGGYDVLPGSGHSTDIGSWVHLATGTVTLPPRTRQIIPFTLAVPAKAAPGDHSGGIVLALRRHEVDAKGNDIAVDQRVGTRIHLRVPGALRPQLVVQSVSVHYRGTLNPFGTGTTTVTYTVHNAGNIRLGGRQAVRVRNAVGAVTTASGPGALTELLPGNSETFTLQIHGVFPTLWSTASITVDPLAVPGDTDPALPSAISDNLYATVPWTLIALLVPLFALAVSLFLRRRRRRRGGPAATPGPAGWPTPPAPAAPTSPPEPAAPTPATQPAPPSPAAVPVPVPSPAAAGPVEADASRSAGEPAVQGAAVVPVPVPSAADADPADVGEPAEVPALPALPARTPPTEPTEDSPVPVAVPAPAAPSAPGEASPADVAGPATIPALPALPSASPDVASPASVLAEEGATPAPDGARGEAGMGPAEAAGVAGRTGHGVVRGWAAVFAAVAAFGGLLGGASPAVADGASATPSATAAGASGTLFFDYASGHDDDPIDLATSGRCPGQGDWLSAGITGPGFPTGGASALGLSAASIYPAASTGGYVIPLDQTLRSIARQSGISTLQGSYRVDVYCRGRFQPAHLRDFVGTLTFSTPGSWTADHSTPVAMPESTEPVMTAKPQPAPTAASGKGGGHSLLSVPATVAGALLLVGLGVSALRRRRAEVLVERKANQVGKKTPDTTAASEDTAEQAEQPAAEAKAARR